MVQQNTIAVWKGQEVSDFWWTIKLYPQPRTLQPYGTYQSSHFELIIDAP